MNYRTILVLIMASAYTGCTPSSPMILINDAEAYTKVATQAGPWSAEGVRRFPLAGHRGWVNAIAFSPNGTLLASGSGDRTIRLWDTASMRSIATLSGHTSGVMTVAFSPSGRLLASGGDDKIIHLWSLPDGQQLAAFEGHETRVTSVLFSPDGRFLASIGTNEKTIQLWDVAKKRRAATLSGHTGSVNFIAFSPNGRYLASGGEKTVRLWDLTSARETATLEGHTNKINCIAFSPDSRMMASGSMDKTIRLWDAANASSIEVLSGHHDGITSITFSPDGRSIASAGRDRTIRLWKMSEGRNVDVIAAEGTIGSIAFSPDGSLLAWGSYGEGVRLWDVSNRRSIAAFDGYAGSIVFSPDGSMLASSEISSNVNIFTATRPADRLRVADMEIDWSTGRPDFAPLARVEVSVTSGNGQRRGSEIQLEINVRNEGAGPLYRFLAVTRSSVEAWDNRPLLFGKIEGGTSKTRLLPLPRPAQLPTSTQRIDILFSELNNNHPGSLSVPVHISPLETPPLSWTYAVLDDPNESPRIVGNADGVIQKGEAVDISFIVRNTGSIDAEDVRLQLALPDDESLEVYGDTTLQYGTIPPGGEQRLSVNVQVKQWSPLNEVPLSFQLTQENYVLAHTGSIRLAFDAAPAVEPWRIDRAMYAADAVSLRSGASIDAPERARLPKGWPVRAVAELHGWIQVEVRLQDQVNHLWVNANELSDRPQQTSIDSTQSPIETRFISLPQIVFNNPRSDIETTDDRFRVQVTVVQQGGRLENIELQVGSGQTTRGIEIVARRPDHHNEQNDDRTIEQTIELADGPNIVRVIARNTAGQTSERSVVITRTPKLGHTYAITIGINSYAAPWTLHCARQDAERFAQFAMKDLGVAADRLTTLLDEDATRLNIMSEFGKLRRQVKPEDTVVVFLAGHGMTDTAGGREERYFVPSDAAWENLFATAIDMNEFSRMLDVSAERVLVIADACHSGDIALRGGSEEIFTPLTGKGRLLVGYQGAAREDRKLGHGYLTYYLLEGLAGPADSNRDGTITLREAYDYATTIIKEITGTGLWIKGEGDLELVRVQ